MPDFAYERIRAGAAMPGVIEVPRQMPIGQAVEDLLLVMEAGQPEDWDHQVIYLPLRPPPEAGRAALPPLWSKRMSPG